MSATEDQPAFLDSNVVLYLLSTNARKAQAVETLLKCNPVISVQVLNEVTHVCVKKLKMDWHEISEFLSLVRHFCRIVALTEAVHDHARSIAEHCKLSFYDACIASAAIAAGCSTLYTEDLNHGQTLKKKLKICNPFMSEIK